MLLRAFAIRKNDTPPKHKLDAFTIPNTQQQNNPEDGSFLMQFQWMSFVPFQHCFGEVIQCVPGISTIEKANGSKNTYQYQAIL